MRIGIKFLIRGIKINQEMVNENKLNSSHCFHEIISYYYIFFEGNQTSLLEESIMEKAYRTSFTLFLLSFP